MIPCFSTLPKRCRKRWLANVSIASSHSFSTSAAPSPRQSSLLGACSWMVNLQYIDHIDPAAGTIHLLNGVEVPLGRAHRDAFFQQLRLVD